MERKPLSSDQKRAAVMLAHGVLHREVAEELQISKRTLSRWVGREDFTELARAERERLFSTGVPSAESVPVASPQRRDRQER